MLSAQLLIKLLHKEIILTLKGLLRDTNLLGSGLLLLPPHRQSLARTLPPAGSRLPGSPAAPLCSQPLAPGQQGRMGWSSCRLTPPRRKLHPAGRQGSSVRAL